MQKSLTIQTFDYLFSDTVMEGARGIVCVLFLNIGIVPPNSKIPVQNPSNFLDEQPSLKFFLNMENYFFVY